MFVDVAAIPRVTRRRLTTARAIYRRGGVREVLLHVSLLLGYHRVILFESPLLPEEPAPPARVPLDFSVVGLEALDELSGFRDDLPRETLRKRLERGERCFVARSHGEVVAAYWIHRFDVPLGEIGHTMVVPDDAVYVGDAWVAEGLRGLGIAASVSRELKNRLAAEGYTRWVFYVLAGNHLGLANARRTNPRETARLAALKLGRLPAIPLPFVPRR